MPPWSYVIFVYGCMFHFSYTFGVQICVVRLCCHFATYVPIRLASRHVSLCWVHTRVLLILGAQNARVQAPLVVPINMAQQLFCDLARIAEGFSEDCDLPPQQKTELLIKLDGLKAASLKDVAFLQEDGTAQRFAVTLLRIKNSNEYSLSESASIVRRRWKKIFLQSRGIGDIKERRSDARMCSGTSLPSSTFSL